MATADSTFTPILLDYPSALVRTYAIAPGASAFDVELLFEAKLSHLEAMLLAVYGEAGEAFRNLSDETQDNYLWACSDLASEIKTLYRAIHHCRQAERKNAPAAHDLPEPERAGDCGRTGEGGRGAV